MPTVSIKDLLDSKDGTVTWGPLTATCVKAPQTVKSTPGNYGDWIRGTFTISDGTGTIDLIWTDPTFPYEQNPKTLEGQSVYIEQGAKVEEYQNKKRVKAKGTGVVTAAGSVPAPPPVVAPGATSAPVAVSQVMPAPAQAYSAPSLTPQLTDRALLQAYAAWGPRLWAILDPSLQAAPGTAQAVAAAMNSMLIAAGQGKLVITLFAEDEQP